MNTELGCEVWEPTVAYCSEIVEKERQEADAECGTNEIKTTLTLCFRWGEETPLSFSPHRLDCYVDHLSLVTQPVILLVLRPRPHRASYDSLVPPPPQASHPLDQAKGSLGRRGKDFPSLRFQHQQYAKGARGNSIFQFRLGYDKRLDLPISFSVQTISQRLSRS